MLILQFNFKRHSFVKSFLTWLSQRLDRLEVDECKWSPWQAYTRHSDLLVFQLLEAFLILDVVGKIDTTPQISGLNGVEFFFSFCGELQQNQIQHPKCPVLPRSTSRWMNVWPVAGRTGLSAGVSWDPTETDGRMRRGWLVQSASSGWGHSQSWNKKTQI